MTNPGRPVPVPDERSRAFWEAAASHRLALARCSTCAHLSHPPSAVCTHCGSTDPAFTFTVVDGSGIVRSWIVVRQSFLPGFEVPFVLVDVELSVQADLRLIGRLLDGPDAELRPGVRVRLAFEDLGPGAAVPAFALERTR